MPRQTTTFPVEERYLAMTWKELDKLRQVHEARLADATEKEMAARAEAARRDAAARVHADQLVQIREAMRIVPEGDRW
ncbi:MAG: hypothetical protein ACRDXE_10545 [Acidimicrobiales bacterium]